MRRFTQSILRFAQMAMSNLQVAWRWILSLFGPETQWYEVFVLLVGIMGAIATQLDMIREVFPVHTLIRMEAWTGSAFGIVSASFIFKAWWLFAELRRQAIQYEGRSVKCDGGHAIAAYRTELWRGNTFHRINMRHSRFGVVDRANERKWTTRRERGSSRHPLDSTET